MFGAAALFGKDSGYVSTVISKTASDVLFVSESKVKELITSDSQVALAYISFLSDRIRFLNRKISAFTAKMQTLLWRPPCLRKEAKVLSSTFHAFRKSSV